MCNESIKQMLKLIFDIGENYFEKTMFMLKFEEQEKLGEKGEEF